MFVGRERELAALEKIYEKVGFQMVVVYGRRRIGKTTLLNRFAQGKRVISFTAQEANDFVNLREFSAKIYSFFGIPLSAGAFSSWKAAFEFLAEKARSERILLIFDEFPYAANANGEICSVLQNCIDQYMKNSQMCVVLCGSHVSWMESEVLGYKSPLFGRRTAQIKIDGFDYYDAARFMGGSGTEDIINYYACIGGTPYYLSQIDTSCSFKENIRALYFTPSGYLCDEPLMLLRQELREPALYNSIIAAIATGASRLNEISIKIGEPTSKTIKYINTLVALKILYKTVPFGENPERSRNGIYRIADNCFTFWYRFVFLDRQAIDSGFGDETANSAFKNLSNYTGHIFETICRQYLVRESRRGRLPFSATEFGSWWGNDPKKREQTDIDVVASDSAKENIILGECKWRETQKLSAADVQTWMDKTYLLSDYGNRYYYCFTKKTFVDSVIKMSKGKKNLALITADMMLMNE